ncbi:hypothetical protein ACFL2F_02305, partial [Myxococcota bacterium]
TRTSRAVAGVCDIAENCNGTSPTCPADLREPATTQCRASAGICDIAENCNGVGTSCPSDVVEPVTTECRAAAGVCDIAENCDGTNVTCPVNVGLPNGTPCTPDANECTDDECNNRVCTHPVAPVVCDDGKVCGSEECDIGMGNPDDCTSPEVCQSNCTCGISTCDGSGAAPNCNDDSDCDPPTCPVDSPGDCYETKCEGGGAATEFQICSDIASGSNGVPCESTTCTNQNGDHAEAVGQDCYSTGNRTISHTTVFNTQSSSGTSFMVWQRIIADMSYESGEQYNCSLTGVSGGTANFSLLETPLLNGTHGPGCAGTDYNGHFCWAAYNLTPFVLDQGEHTLTCSITTNATNEFIGFDGIIFTTDLAYVPDEGGPACDSDALFTAGTCNTPPLDWGPNEYTSGGGGKCNSNVPLLAGTACDDGLACNENEDCDGAGVCGGGSASVCNDGVACTDDSCVEPTGCIFTPNDSLCADDGNPCTVSVCDQFLGCQINNRPNGTACTIDTCNSTCLNGVCNGCVCLSDADCVDADPCTVDVCDIAAGSCVDHYVEVIPFSTGPGLRRISGNGQFGPVPASGGTRLPNPLIVQLNQTGGCEPGPCAPVAGTNITFEIWPYTDDSGDPAVCDLCPDTNDDGVCDNRGNQCTCDPYPGHPLCPVGSCARCVNYCYGKENFYSTPTGEELYSTRVCNTDEGVIVNLATAAESTSLVVQTDANGQAAVGLKVPDDGGITVVRATGAGQEVVFFAAGMEGLSNVIGIPADQGPAIGPLSWTESGNGTSQAQYLAYLLDWKNYELSFTEVTVTTGSTYGVPSAPLYTVPGTDQLTINIAYAGIVPATDCAGGYGGPCFAAGGNQVWIGGVLANVVAESTTSITVDIPEGIPGAASVMVADGSSTNFKDWEKSLGSVGSMAAKLAVFQRVAPKPIFINAWTSGRAETQAKVKLMAWDNCSSISLAGATLVSYDPDRVTPSDTVVVASAIDGNGVAAVKATTTGKGRSAVIIGTVAGVSSDSFADGNTVVTAIPHIKSADGVGTDVYTASGLGNSNGENSFIMRVGDEDDSATISEQNPTVLLSSLTAEAYTIPDGSTDDCFETEGNIAVSTLEADGVMENLGITEGPGGTSGRATATGTGILVLAGGAMTDDAGVVGSLGRMGATVIASLYAWLDPDDGSAGGVQDPFMFNLSGNSLVTALVQTATRQNWEGWSSSSTYLDPPFGSYRNMIFKLLFWRSRPISANEPCPACVTPPCAP